MRKALFVVLLLAVAAPAHATDWIVNNAASSVRFASSFNGAPFSGAFRRWDARVSFDPADLVHSSVTASIDTGSAATGDADRDQALPTPTFLASAKFPRATFAASQFRPAGPGRFLAIGTLTLRGVSKPLTLPFTLAITGETARMSASVGLNRLAFGVGQDEWKATTALPAAVTVTIALTATRAK